MKEGTASHTARSVAARRLEYERVAAPYGDPAADEALTSDVAAGLTPSRGRMHEYLRARTAFFDRAVVRALDEGIAQVVIGGAGYDGRAFRYARPGVRWFEVDHPATQADKLARIARLGLAAARIGFIPADFTAGPVEGPLLAAGLDPARPALFLFEGVAVYLERDVTERVLAGFRAVTPPGSTLAISLSVHSAPSATRARFQRRVAELGEPARTVLTFGQATTLLSAAGWQAAPASERQRSAGLLLARAATAPVYPERVRPSPPPSATPPAAPASPEPSAQQGSDPVGAARDEGPPPGLPAEPGSDLADAARAPGPAPASGPEHAVAPGDRDQALASASPATAPPAELPLSALLSQALVAFTIEADNEAEHRLPHHLTDPGGPATGVAGGSAGPWLTSLLMHANCLRHLPDEGVTIAELTRRARTGTNLDGMCRWGYVTFTPDPGRGKRPRLDALIRPTPAGIAARDTWQQVTPAVESRWRDRLGEEAFAALHAALVAVVVRLDPLLPDCLPILGYGLTTRRNGERLPGDAGPAPAAAPDPAASAAPPPSAVPPPAAPSSAAAGFAAGLPLWALLSRALLAFARQYEAEPGPSLAISADVLRVLTPDGVLTRDIPGRGGISKESVAMAAGVLRQWGMTTEGPDPAGGRFKVTRLTAPGVAARDAYPVLAAGVERDWRARLGDARVTALRAALESLEAGDPPPLRAGLEPYPDGWRARRPRPATLPHYPMTLHRGGYPDGS